MLRKIRILLQTLVGILLPAFVFAQTNDTVTPLVAVDGRLVFLKTMQIIFAIGILATGGYAGFLVYAFKKNRDNLLVSARTKKRLIITSIIGASLLVCFIFFSLLYWVIDRSDDKGGVMVKGKQEEMRAFGSFESGFGEYDKILSRYPEQDQRNVPRNVVILISLTEPISTEGVMGAGGSLRTDRIQITRTTEIENADSRESGRIEVLDGNTTLKITPSRLLGDAGKKVMYQVTLSSEIQKPGGASLFGSGRDMAWQFEVSGFMDTSPVFLESLLPSASEKPSAAVLPPNALLQFNFSEPLDPESVQSSSIQILSQGDEKPLAGSLSLSNNFKTVTFTPSEVCGKNACGESMHCFPRESAYKIVIKSATLQKSMTTQDSNKAQYPYTGIVDSAGNSFDGGGLLGGKRNAKAEGTPDDDYSAAFSVGKELELSQPMILYINPGRDMPRIPVRRPIDISFSKLMDAQSVHSGSINLFPAIEHSFSIAHNQTARKTTVTVQHSPFKENTVYRPEVNSSLRDLYQNCLSQCIGPLK